MRIVFLCFAICNSDESPIPDCTITEHKVLFFCILQLCNYAIDESPGLSTVPPGPSTFPRRTQCQRENGRGKRQSRSSAGFVFRGGGAFSDLRKGHHSFEDPKTDQVAHWRWRFFGSSGKKTIGGSDLNAFPPSDGLTKRRKCVSTAAASSGFARVQDRASTW